MIAFTFQVRANEAFEAVVESSDPRLAGLALALPPRGVAQDVKLHVTLTEDPVPITDGTWVGYSLLVELDPPVPLLLPMNIKIPLVDPPPDFLASPFLYDPEQGLDQLQLISQTTNPPTMTLETQVLGQITWVYVD